MRKFIFTFLVSLICVGGFAQNRYPQLPARPPMAQVQNMPDVSENYDMSEIDIDRLAERLKLNDYQTEYLKITHENMVDEIAQSAEKHGFVKTRSLDKAIANNIKSMKKVLNDEQFKLYSELLTTTIRNNFNMMLYNTFKDMPRRRPIPFRRNIPTN